METFPLIVALALAAPLPSFRDAALEARCDALKSFVAEWHASDKTFRAGGCAEGNGLGGALYTLDFKVGDKNEDHRAAITFDGDGPVKVQIRPPIEALEQALAKWAGASPSSLTIYGKSYDDFVKGVMAYDGYYPATRGAKASTLKFRLVPDADPRAGRIRFEGKADADFLKCFDCGDAACVEGEVRYRFQDRFFSLIRKASENFGAGWIVQGPLPIGPGGNAWKFVCGVTRYSLESIDL